MRDRRRQAGTTTVEFVSVIPVLVLLTAGALDAGRMVVSRAMLTPAAICCARAGIAKANATSDAQNAAFRVAPMLSLTTTNVTVTTSNATWSARTHGDTVTCTANYTFTPGTGHLTLLTQKNFVAQSTMTIP